VGVDFNEVRIIGNLGRDAELTYTSGGRAKLKFSVAHNRNYKNKNGGQESKTTWVNCVMWGDTAEKIAPDMTKGKHVLILGSLESYSYDRTIEGVNFPIKTERVEINTTRVIYLPEGRGGNGGTQEQKGNETFDDDDVPF
jgi:single-strand DNA-binding protein